jgi:hypothetical protein
MRFHPKRRASTDQAPGPSSASAALMVPNRMLGHGSPVSENAFHSETIATSAPAMGVHKPATRRSPAATASTCTMTGVIGRPIGRPPRSSATPRKIIAMPATNRMTRRPTPGEPRANVEKRRRTRKARLRDSRREPESPKGWCESLFRES